jgi:multidrug transporter EmrE-like cation transporter
LKDNGDGIMSGDVIVIMRRKRAKPSKRVEPRKEQNGNTPKQTYFKVLFVLFALLEGSLFILVKIWLNALIVPLIVLGVTAQIGVVVLDWYLIFPYISFSTGYNLYQGIVYSFIFIASILLLGESLDPFKLIGILLIGIGAVLA